MATTPPADPQTSAVSERRPATTLALATAGFTICFWAWALLGPFGSDYAEELGLTSFQQSFLVAVPVIVGSLGRIPVGAMTDRLGARVMFPAVAGLTILPVLFIGLVADSYPALLVGGFFLGLGGTAFAIGVPFVNAWYPPHRRGLALGVFGAGMGGTAIAAFTDVPIADAWGREAPYLIVAAILAVYAVVAGVMLRDATSRTVAAGSFARKVWNTLRMPVTLQMSLLYAVGFGGFVAFSVYLPTYLVNAYGLDEADAAFRTAGFVVLAVVMRPVAGYLSDRFGPVPVLVWSFAAASALAVLASLELELLPAGTVAFLGLAATLGAVSGAVFALVAELVEPPKVGSVTGVVGAAGGLGGFVPPLIMGGVYGAFGHYAVGLLLLAAMALIAGVFTWRSFGHLRHVPTKG
ncbi:MFS transporter [Haloactinopolyspora sp.]|uniref:MFS transporter n=1 Tax=Haloactinopolyspora sp. TaxID=1966353 RepID=UPI00263344F5|nr:MFS transporter [Haloactinopolyspora sp.]